MHTGRFQTSGFAAGLALLTICAACNRGSTTTSPASASVRATNQRVTWNKVAFRPSSERPADLWEAQIGNLKLRLAHPEHAEHPTVWEGPLEIQDGSASCQSDVSLVTAVYAAPGVPDFVVATYSGSLTYVDFIGKACERAWPQIKAFTEGVQVGGERLTILPGCEGTGSNEPATCSAAQVFKFDGASPPALQQSESLALTQKMLGVQFEGSRKVLHPKSTNAKLVE